VCAPPAGEDVLMPRRLLIVDDHTGFRRSAGHHLKRHGWNVVGHAADGASALAEVARLSPDVVLLDVNLPDRSGLAVARQLRREWPDVAVVVISTHGREDYAEIAAASGARGFLSKVDLSGPALDRVLRV
jgi:DNA-binding NarL/FixJ family response regulator